MKHTVSTLIKQKQEGKKISMLTCYDYSTARLMDDAGIEVLLVGDSLGMVMLGLADTLSVTMEDMIHHTKAVARGTKNALVLGDMPFMSYQASVEEAKRNAGRLIKEGKAEAVKLEGGAAVCNEISAITSAGIPVCAHLGLTPQSVNAFGGFKAQGRDEDGARRIVEDAISIERAGAFMVVLECIPYDLASLITKKLSIPTIGIGAGAGCDGQVLVYHDMTGLYKDKKPKMAKCFGDAGKVMTDAFSGYDREVKSGTFPLPENSFAIDSEIIKRLENEYL